jgi:hypothetical protein
MKHPLMTKDMKRIVSLLLALAAITMLAVSTSLAAAKGGKATSSTGEADASKPAKEARAQGPSLPFPPTLPEGKEIVTDTSPDFLKPSGSLREGVLVAKTAPVVDFLYFPNQDHPGNPWSVWGDGSVGKGKYYTAIGDHLYGVDPSGQRKGTAQVYEYDPQTKKIRLLVDTKSFLERSGILTPDMKYIPGKIHARIQMGSDGCIYYSTHRGSPSATTDANGHKGDCIFKTDPTTGKTEIVGLYPVEKHCIPASSLDAQRMIYYGGTAPGTDAPAQDVQFLAYDLKNRKVLKSCDGGFKRYAIFSSSTGKLFWDNKVYDPATNEITPSNAPDVRSATTETRDGWVYGTTERGCDIWGYNVKTDKVEELGSGQVGKATYTTTMEVDPSGRYLYYVPGGHGGGAGDGTPIVQFDVKTRKAKVLAFLYDFYHKKYGYTLDGTFSTALDEKGETLYVTWNGMRDNAPKKGWESCAMTAIHIPESERQP